MHKKFFNKTLFLPFAVSCTCIVIIMMFINKLAIENQVLNNKWHKLTEKEITISNHLLLVENNFGYGGFIHNFKNYVLRNSSTYLNNFNSNTFKIKKHINALNKILKTPAEQQALAQLSLVVDNYQKQIALIKKMHKKNSRISEIEQNVYIDDSKALAALNQLRKNIKVRYQQAYQKIQMAINHQNRLINGGRLAILPIIFLFYLLNLYLKKLKHSKSEALKANQWLDSLFDTVPQAIICVNTQAQIVRVNNMACNLFGYSEREMCRLEINQLLPSPFREKHHSHIAAFFKANKPITIGVNRRLKAKLKDGSIIKIKINLSIAGEGDNKVAIASIYDTTQEDIISDKLKYQAHHDNLTGLINRQQFEQQLHLSLAEAKTQNTQHILCFLDLDQFKLVNDTAGHIAGDELLKQISYLLKSHLRTSDILGRLGGDEFGLLLHDCTLDAAIVKAEKLLSLIDIFRFSWESKLFSIGVSIGVTIINKDSESTTDILKQADTACFAAKNKGRNQIQVYHEQELNHDNDQKINEPWSPKVIKGLEQDDFCLYIQPVKANHQNASKAHYEVLLRYQEKDGQIIPPNAFLPAIERYNLSSKVDLWVINKVLAFIKEQKDKISQTTIFSINLSTASITSEKMRYRVIALIEKYNLSANQIIFEITETAAISNLESAKLFISCMKAKGCLFALDDFGSGLSSFGYLKNLDIDYLKIDGLFIRNMLNNEVNKAMVEAIHNIGHIMGLKTVAEFVESKELEAELIKIGIDYCQGYAIAKPKPIEEL